ncbi:MAG: arginine--tRNA ligase [Clostridia bacterium]|nr:arginine--tRNA ligase [Clostridia bacterium]
MKILTELKKELTNIFEKLNLPKDLVTLSFSDRPEVSDFQCNSAFALAKILHKSPQEIANLIAYEFKNSNFQISVCAPGFINFNLNQNCVEKYLKELDESPNLLADFHAPKKIVLDYGGPNVAKPLHVGHLRPAIIGESLKRLAKFFGDEVISDVHLGDWGLQMGLTIAGLEEEFDLGYFSGKSSIKPNITIEDLNRIYPAASAKSKEDESFKKHAQEITTNLQHKTEPYFSIWKEIRKISVDQIKEEYAKLNVSFDLYNGESDSQIYIPKVFEILNGKNLIKLSEGAEIVEVAKESDNAPMPPVIVRSSAGAELYATTDIATILEREEKFSPDEIWYTTDNRQCLHFEQVFRVCKLANIGGNVKFYHCPFGTINGTDGKPFKTRDGGVMSLAKLIDLVTEKSNEKLKENNGEENKALAQDIGVSALKFGDLINFRTKDYVLDLDKFCSFDGKTGPYILYTIVRINSILLKAGEFEKDYNLQNDCAKNILIDLLKLSQEMELGYEQKSLSGICQAAYNLASDFSTIYSNVRILNLTGKERNEYLTLINIIQKTLSLVCNILAINIPEKM